MSWQTYVDDHLMCDIEGNHLTSAAILSHDGSVWAQSTSFPKFKPEEITGIMKDLDELGFLAPTRLYLGGIKYMVIQNEPGAMIRGKKNSKMPSEESENGRDDMLIDGCEPEQPRGNSVPDGFNMNYLKVYYGKLFPHHDIFKWMSYGNDGKHPACDRSYFGQREFSFTLDNDIYLRFQSFNSASELENSINEKCPVKIDIGPVYNVDVRFVYFIFAPAKA